MFILRSLITWNLSSKGIVRCFKRGGSESSQHRVPLGWVSWPTIHVKISLLVKLASHSLSFSLVCWSCELLLFPYLWSLLGNCFSELMTYMLTLSASEIDFNWMTKSNTIINFTTLSQFYHVTNLWDRKSTRLNSSHRR